jgi:hypothetical protein
MVHKPVPPLVKPVHVWNSCGAFICTSYVAITVWQRVTRRFTGTGDHAKPGICLMSVALTKCASQCVILDTYMDRLSKFAREYWSAVYAIAQDHGKYLRDLRKESPLIAEVLHLYVVGWFMKDRRVFSLNPTEGRVVVRDPWIQTTNWNRVRRNVVHIATPAASSLLLLCQTILNAPPMPLNTVLYRGESLEAPPAVGDVRTMVLPFSTSWASPFAETFPEHKVRDACCLHVYRLTAGVVPCLVLQGPPKTPETSPYSSIAYEVVLPPCVTRVVNVEKRAAVPVTHPLVVKLSGMSAIDRSKSRQRTMTVVTHVIERVLDMPRIVHIGHPTQLPERSAQLLEDQASWYSSWDTAVLSKPAIRVSIGYGSHPPANHDHIRAVVTRVPASKITPPAFAVVLVSDDIPLRTLDVVREETLARDIQARWRSLLTYPDDPYSWYVPTATLLPSYETLAAQVYLVAKNWPLGISNLNGWPGFDWEVFHEHSERHAYSATGHRPITDDPITEHPITEDIMEEEYAVIMENSGARDGYMRGTRATESVQAMGGKRRRSRLWVLHDGVNKPRPGH